MRVGGPIALRRLLGSCRDFIDAMAAEHTDIPTIAEAIDHEMCARGSAERAERKKAYIKSELVHYGTNVPETRSIVRAALRNAGLKHA